MDPFTQRMLERAKMRREKLENHLTNSQESPSTTLPETLCINRGDCSDIEFDLKDKNDKHCLTGLRKMKLQKLAQLYSETNENLILNEGKLEEGLTNLSKKNQFKTNKLAELTAKIIQWEDDNSYPKQHVTGVKVFNNVTSENVKEFGENPIIWNPSMLEKLRTQGFSLSDNQSKLTYDFKETQKKPKLMHLKCTELLHKTELCDNASNFPQENVKTKSSDPFYQNSETNKFALPNYNNTIESKVPEKDPADLSLAERRALFERNENEDCKLNQKLTNLKPSCCWNLEKKSKISSFDTCFSNKKENKTTKHDLDLAEKENFNVKSITKNSYEQNFSLNKNMNFGNNEKIKGNGTGTEYSEVNLPESFVKSPIVNDDEQDIFKSLNNLDSSNIVSILPSGRLYPSLDNLKSNDCDLDLDALESIALNESNTFYVGSNSKIPSVTNENNSSKLPVDYSFSKSKEFQVLNRMDILLENALNNITAKNENILELSSPTPPKISNNSICEYNTSKTSPLLHTLSFYRKQQISATIQDELNENEKESLKFKEDQAALVEDKIQFLVAEVNKQQTIMSQASQALNLCLSTVEFSGSGEQVEGERLLLLASHKRQACLNEIQRLKIDKCLQSFEENNFEKGDVTLSNITIKLKRDALRAMAVAESLQYFVCLVKSEERVLATPVVPATRENLKDLNLQFPGILKLEGLLSDFKVSIEVYNLELNKEILPHDIKYHIVNKKDKKLLTPIKSKKSESKLIKPQIQSPAGPNAIRSSNFQMCGYIVFSLRELNRTQWTLNKVPYMSSLEGSISMTVQSQLHLDDEHRGFLTMFEDISGFGAWHRRWCLLSSHIISFWKYPDDEQKKIPIGSIDLRSVTTENVGLVSRDICARLYTFLLESRRPRLHEDRNSLVLRVEDNATIIRQLLSADSKKDMTIWCKKINATLALLRSWKCNID